jgi:hypothetical protein
MPERFAFDENAARIRSRVRAASLPFLWAVLGVPLGVFGSKSASLHWES